MHELDAPFSGSHEGIELLRSLLVMNLTEDFLLVWGD